jgi:hypothetical protein
VEDEHRGGHQQPRCQEHQAARDGRETRRGSGRLSWLPWL